MLKHLDSILLIIYLLIITVLFGYYTFVKSDDGLLIFFLLSAFTFVATSTKFIKKYRDEK